MATIVITVGANSSTITLSNADALEALDGLGYEARILDENGIFIPNPQTKFQFFIGWFRSQLRSAIMRARVPATTLSAERAVETQVNAISITST